MIDRRDFLKTTAAATAALAVTKKIGLAWAAPSEQDLPPGLDGVTWDKAPCRFCGTGCHVQVGVKDGRVVSVTGDRQAAVNKGLLCAKGYHVAGILYGKDRLTQPLLRKHGELVPITWNEALDVIAERIEAAPDRFAFYGSGQWTIPEGYAAQKLMKGGLGSNHIDPNARLCMASAVTGFIGTYGVDEPAGCYDDLDRADVVLLWGNNPAEMHPILFSRILDRRLRGERVEIFDLGTRRTRSTGYADHFLNFKPHTDLAIANGIAHLLLARGTWNREFVARHCNFRKNPPGKQTLRGVPSSFEEYAKLLEPYTPAYVEEVSGVPARYIELLADRFGDPKLRITSLWCMGMNQHTRGTAINTLVHGVHLLSGHFGRPGDAPTSLTGQPSACGTVREVGTLAHALPGGRVVASPEHRAQSEAIWNVPEGRINPKPGYHTVAMWDAFTKPAADGGDIDTIWVQVTNPGQTLPNLQKLFTDKPEGKFLIVSDGYPTATTRLADLVLPSALWIEKNGVFGNSERRTQQWFRQVMPPGEARDDCWQTVAVARRLFDRGFAGMKDKDGAFLFAVRDADGKEVPVWEWEHYYDVNVDAHLFEEYRKFTRLKHKDLAPYQEYVKARGLRWPVVERGGRWQETRFRFTEGEDPYVKAGAGIQFYHSTTEDDRAQIWFHPYEPPPEVPDGDYPFWLCTGRVLEHWHTGTMTMRVPTLRAAVPHAYVELNAKDALDLGVNHGDTVEVATRRGALRLPASVGGRGEPPQGSLFVPFFDERFLINTLTLDAVDPISKQPDYKKCAARVRRVVG
ncbi:MAG: twin-arginine translocation signal domain-containing protein [Deltaproteobacteria bacterium]|nr:MAG: twin-arginine translocation signal domain-containing protein [Deltaproteobacteria bacterium]